MTAPKLVRRVRTFLLVGLIGVALAAAGLSLRSLHRIRQAAEFGSRLRQMGAQVTEIRDGDDRWSQLAQTVGFPAAGNLFDRTACFVTLNGPTASADALHIAGQHPYLTALTVQNAPYLDDDAFAALGGSTGVRELKLHKTGITDAGLRYLRRWNRLQSVVIDECPVSDKGIRLLCELPSVNVVACEKCLTETSVQDLAYASPEAPTPQVGRPLKISGRVRFNSKFQAPTAALRVVVAHEAPAQPNLLYGSAAVNMSAANEAAFTVTARNGGAELQPGRIVLLFIVELSSKSVIRFVLDRINLDATREQ